MFLVLIPTQAGYFILVKLQTLAIAFLATISLAAATVAAGNAPADVIVFNLKTHKMHARNCPWAFKCTRSCIKITRESALKKGGIPCKICHADVN